MFCKQNYKNKEYNVKYTGLFSNWFTVSTLLYVYVNITIRERKLNPVYYTAPHKGKIYIYGQTSHFSELVTKKWQINGQCLLLPHYYHLPSMNV